MKENKIIRDLSLAVYLSLSGHRIIKTTAEGRIVLFHFEETQKLLEDVNKFYNREGRVEPIAYGETLRHYKSIIGRGGL